MTYNLHQSQPRAAWQQVGGIAAAVAIIHPCGSEVQRNNLLAVALQSSSLPL
ncbi:MAG: hypothetical protein OXC63_12310 [Aestuariivita sp.]|nr:hypothetical protein [Aestuariivita sp.]MCY4347753.1 hypothetical protein [Aestuariivita sp.]